MADAPRLAGRVMDGLERVQRLLARWPGALLGGSSVLALLLYPHPLAWAGLGGLGVLLVARWRAAGRPWPASPLTAPLLLYLAGAVVGLAITTRPDMAWVRFFGLLAALGGCWLILDRVRSLAAAERVVEVSLAGALLTGEWLLILIAPELRLDRLPGPLSAFAESVQWMSLPWNGVRAAAGEISNLGQRYRISTAGLGIFATFGLGLALGPLLAGSSRAQRAFGALSAVAFALLLILPANRTAWLLAAFLPLALLALRYRWALAGLLAGLGVLAAALAAGAGLLAAGPLGALVRRLPEAARDPGPLFERLEYWQNYLFLLSDFRWSGVGLGLRAVADLYRRRFLPIDPGFNHAHNIFIQSYLEQGVLGLVGMVWLAGAGLVLCARALRHAKTPSARVVAISSSGAALALLLDGLTEIVTLTTLGMVLLFGALALAGVAARATAPAAPRPRLVMHGRWRTALLVALAVTLGPMLLFGRGSGQAGLWLTEPSRLPSAFAAQVALNVGAVQLTRAMLDDAASKAERNSRLASAEAAFQRARELDPENRGVYRNLAELALARDQLSEARRLLAQARALATDDDEAFYFQVGRLYQQTGSVDLALSAWSRVDRTLFSWSCSSTFFQLLNWGEALLEDERFESAAKVARAAIATVPADPRGYDLLARAVAADDGVLAAERALQGVAADYPSVPWPYQVLARLAAASGRGDAAALQSRASELEGSRAWRELRAQYRLARECQEFFPEPR